MNNNGTPFIERVHPAAALPGGEISIFGGGFGVSGYKSPQVRFGEVDAGMLLAADSFLVARVPDDAQVSEVRVHSGESRSAPGRVVLGRKIADNLHPVTNPAIDAEGNVYATYSGQRGQRVPVSLYRISDGHVRPFVTELINPTGLAVANDGALFVTCRHDGTVHRITPDGQAGQWIEGMGVATGLAFDARGNLYVGDRSGTIFKIGPDRRIYVFATLEPSVAAYHLAFNAAGDLFVTGPTQSSYDHVYRITPEGEVSVFYRGLGRPQGMAFDAHGNLYVAASLAGRRGIIRITPSGEAGIELAGSNIVGLAMQGRHAVVATINALYSLDWDVEGLPLFG